MLSGEERPILAKAKIAARQENILNGPQGEKRRERLEARIQEAQQEKERHSAGHTQYLRLEKQLRQDFERHFERQYPSPKPSSEPRLSAYPTSYEQHLEQASKRLREFHQALERETTKRRKWEEYLYSKMPPELIKECEAWRAADRLIPKLYEEVERLPEWARNEAERQLTREAYRNRKIATNVWFILTGTAFMLTVAFFISGYWRFPKSESTLPSGPS
jgi:RNA processing factor Prp31